MHPQPPHTHISMLLAILYTILGLVGILVGASLLTDGASAIAKKMGLSELIIGLTVVSFGTSMPEWIISTMSAIDHNAPLAVGNVVGSNIFNILAIIGITSLIRPIKVSREILTVQIPFVLLSSVVLLVMANGRLLNGSPANVISRSDGIILVLFFAVFMWYTVKEALTQRAGQERLERKEEDKPDDKAKKPISQLKAWIMLLVGLALLIFGGDKFVDGASDFALRLGVSEGMIGLTIAAVGTSLPELATSAAAAIKKQNGIAVGNVIGSCVFNVFFVLGTAATIYPLAPGTIGNFDLLTLTGASLLFWIFGWFFANKEFTRTEGALLTAAYIAYMALIIMRA